MDPFLLVKLLLLSCNLDEEGNQHFVTEKPEESQKLWPPVPEIVDLYKPDNVHVEIKEMYSK